VELETVEEYARVLWFGFGDGGGIWRIWRKIEGPGISRNSPEDAGVSRIGMGAGWDFRVNLRQYSEAPEGSIWSEAGGATDWEALIALVQNTYYFTCLKKNLCGVNNIGYRARCSGEPGL